MQKSKIVLGLGIATALLAGCRQQEPAVADAPETEAVAASAELPAAPAEQAPPPVEPAAAPAGPAAPTAAAFDIAAIPVSDGPLPEWPYVALPAGYELDDADDVAGNTKDLARVPVWTGGGLSWVEGKVFSDGIDNSDDKTFSKFELRKNLQQSIEALGGVRVSERSYDEATYKANEKELEDFRNEFSEVRNAYWYDADADTYVIRRADAAIWIVAQVRNNDASVMVAEGPLPESPGN